MNNAKAQSLNAVLKGLGIEIDTQVLADAMKTANVEGVTIDIAHAMDKITPEMMNTARDIMIETLVTDSVKTRDELDTALTRVDILTKSLTAHRVAVLEQALRPFANTVFNDNGDMTVSDTHLLKHEDFAKAYYALRSAIDVDAGLGEYSDGATGGKWGQFSPAHGPFKEEAMAHYKSSGWMNMDTSHDMSAIVRGKPYRVATFHHADDAAFAEAVVNAYREGRLVEACAPFELPSDVSELRDVIEDVIVEVLGDAYDCTRVWEAWDVGTMGEEDFVMIAQDDTRVSEFVDGILMAITPRPLIESKYLKGTIVYEGTATGRLKTAAPTFQTPDGYDLEADMPHDDTSARMNWMYGTPIQMAGESDEDRQHGIADAVVMVDNLKEHGTIDAPDTRPKNCRERLRESGEAYPRSGCEACGANLRTGLGKCV